MEISQSYQATFQPRPIFIVIAGNIGSGKSTLTKHISEYLGFKPYYEPVKENKYLELYYKDMERYGFTMQIYLLSARFRQHQQVLWNQENVVQDRSIYEDVIFAKMVHDQGNMSDLDFETYINIFSDMSNFLRQPDLMLFLDATPEKCMERIKERGRECEKGLPIEYLKDLEKGYKDWMQARIPTNTLKLTLDWNEYKPVEEVVRIINDLFVTEGVCKRLVPVVKKVRSHEALEEYIRDH